MIKMVKYKGILSLSLLFLNSTTFSLSMESEELPKNIGVEERGAEILRNIRDRAQKVTNTIKENNEKFSNEINNFGIKIVEISTDATNTQEIMVLQKKHEAELEKIGLRLQELQGLNVKQQDLITQLQSEKESLQKALEEKKSLVESGKGDREKLIGEIEAGMKLISSLDVELSDFKKQAEENKKTIANFSGQLNEANQQIAQLEEKITSKRSKITGLKSKLQDMVDSKEKDLENAIKKLMDINSQRMEVESKKSQEAEKTYEDRINFINASYEDEHKKAEVLGTQLRELQKQREAEIEKTRQESLKVGKDANKVKAAFIIAVNANAERQKEIDRLKLENSQFNVQLANVHTAWINSLNDVKAELQFFKDEVQSVYYQYNVPLSIVGATQSKTEKVVEKEEPSFFTNFFPTWWCDSNPATFTTGKCKLPPTPKKTGTNVSPKQKPVEESYIDYSQAPKSMGESFNQMIGKPYHDESQDPSNIGH